MFEQQQQQQQKTQQNQCETSIIFIVAGSIQMSRNQKDGLVIVQIQIVIRIWEDERVYWAY